jgi:DNA-directed RNA polymerase subunit RPC12/RpoP
VDGFVPGKRHPGHLTLLEIEMGDIADMMLDGILCEGCGVYMGGNIGFARRCGSCKREESQPRPDERVPCKVCGRRVKFIGMSNHMKDAHPKGTA